MLLVFWQLAPSVCVVARDGVRDGGVEWLGAFLVGLHVLFWWVLGSVCPAVVSLGLASSIVFPKVVFIQAFVGIFIMFLRGIWLRVARRHFMLFPPVGMELLVVVVGLFPELYRATRPKCSAHFVPSLFVLKWWLLQKLHLGMRAQLTLSSAVPWGGPGCGQRLVAVGPIPLCLFGGGKQETCGDGPPLFNSAK